MTKWISIKDGKTLPEADIQYLVTIKKNDYSDDRVVTVGSFNYDPFKNKYDWLHGDRMVAFAEMPQPFKG